MKKILFILASFLLVFTFTIEVSAVTREAYNIITTPGEDMSTSMTISYHSDVEGSYVEYTLKSDPNYENATKVEVDSFYWGEAKTVTGANGNVGNTDGIYERYVCSVTITGLTPDTEYIYHVGRTTFSKDYHFKTAKGTGDFTFVHMTDPQFYTQAGADVFNDLMTLTYNKKDVAFSVISGDINDKGAINSYWEMFFNEPNIDLSPLATVPGNHEYYAATNSVTLDSRFYNGYIRNVANGAESSPNSSYFFMYNNALFVMIDSENQAQGNSQTDWFCEVVESHPAQYIVVSMHRSFYGSVYADVSSGLRNTWQKYFDKYGVDLVLTGHDHVYTRSYPVYNGVKSSDPYRGTTYVTGGCAGDKMTYSVVPNEMYAASVDLSKTKLSTISMIDVLEDKMVLTALNENGEVIDTCELPAKRSANSGNVSTLTKKEMMDSISLDIDENDMLKGTISWDENAYGLVSSVKAVTDRSVTINDLYLYTDKYNSFEANFNNNMDYVITVTVTFVDKTTETKEIKYTTKLPWGEIKNVRLENYNEEDSTIDLLWDVTSLNDQLDTYRVYLNGVAVTGRFKEPLSKITIPDFVADFENEIRFEAFNKYYDKVFTTTLNYTLEKEYTLTVSDSEVNLKEGETKTVTATVSPETDEAITWTSSNEEVVTVEEGVINAIKAGTATITVKCGDKEEIITVTIAEKEVIDEPDVPTPPKDEKTGCNAASINTLILSFGLLAFTFIRRRKY